MKNNFKKKHKHHLKCMMLEAYPYSYVLILLTALIVIVALIASGCTIEKTIKEKKSLTYFSIDCLSDYGDMDIDFIEYIIDDNEYRVLNNSDIDTRVSPCSTFKIVNSLIALEESIVSENDSYKEWDGKRYYYDSWNQNQTMESAFKNSVVWYYQDIARQIGASSMKSYIEKINYGNMDISGGIDEFWLASSLSISPKEQVDLLRSIFLEDKFFSDKNIKYLEELMFIGEYDGIKLYGKTGSSNEPSIGWLIGFYEHDGKRIAYATHISSDKSTDKVSGLVAKEITLDILKSLTKDD